MALSFTIIPDRTGPAIYLIGNGQSQIETQLMELGNQINQATAEDTQIVYLDPNHGDGLKVKEFYSLQVLPSALIVLDDDTIAHQWDNVIPRSDEITYILSQINGSMRAS